MQLFNFEFSARQSHSILNDFEFYLSAFNEIPPTPTLRNLRPDFGAGHGGLALGFKFAHDRRMSNVEAPNETPRVQHKVDLEEIRLRDMERSIADHLMGRYGPVLDIGALVETLKFPSKDALERSLERGHLRLAITDMPNRRGKFALAQNVARYLVEISTEKDFQDSGESALDLGKERPH